MTVRDIAAAVGVGKSSVSWIINQQRIWGQCLQNERVNVDANRLKGAGHLARMNEDRCCEKFSLEKSMGNRDLGTNLC
ncbi:hypothetical protein TNCV_3971901 [Trichonephila clavipes]|nr:hypothetical protein TNCV_3971901 [Trichonephila clavipes]